MVAWQMGLVLALVAVLLILFVREVIPIPITALLGAVVLTASGILTPEEGFSGFSSEATIAVLAMFVLSAGVRRTGLIDALTNAIIRRTRGSSRKKILALGATVGPVSGFLNNTAVVAVMLPAAFRLARADGQAPSRLLIPLSTFAMLGGLLTVIGTSTNLLGNALLPGYGLPKFAFFDFLPVGLVALAIGVAYYLTIGHALLPDRGRGGYVERYDLKGFLAEFEVRPDSDAAGQTLQESGLVWTSGALVVRVVRGERQYDAPSGDFRPQGGDRILVEASRQRLAQLAADGPLHPIGNASELGNDTSVEGSEPTNTAEIVVTPGSRLIGKTLAELRFPQQYDATVLAVRHHGRAEIGPLATAALAAGDVLLVRAAPAAIDRLREYPDFVLTRSREHQESRRHLSVAALMILVAVVGLAALEIMPIAVAALAGAVAMVLTGCLRSHEFLDAIEWDVILLLAGVIPLGIALEKTGAAQMLARGVADLGGPIGPTGFLILLFLITTLITEIVSNNASVVLLIPVAMAAAQGLAVSPTAVAMVVIVAASTSMMTPIGYQTNTMIYAPGNYRFSDFFRTGAPLNAILVIVLPLVIQRLY